MVLRFAQSGPGGARGSAIIYIIIYILYINISYIIIYIYIYNIETLYGLWPSYGNFPETYMAMGKNDGHPLNLGGAKDVQTVFLSFFDQFDLTVPKR